MTSTERTRRWRERHPEQARRQTAEGMRKLREADPEEARRRTAERMRQWRQRNKADPRKTQAHKAVERAVRSGQLVRPEACERCGRPTSVAHHEDYDKPLEVVWLCRACHGERHVELRYY